MPCVAEAAKGKATPVPAVKAPTPSTSAPSSRGGSTNGKKRQTEAGSSAGQQQTQKGNLAQDLAGLGLQDDEVANRDNAPVPEMSMKRAELVEKLRGEAEAQQKKGVSLVVIGE